MPVDHIEHMTIKNLPAVPEESAQLELVRILASNPDRFRMLFLQLSADLRIHARYALLNEWAHKYDLKSVNITDFTLDVMNAIHDGTWLTALKHWEEPDILLVDGLDLIIGSNTVQEIFYTSVLKPRLEKKRLTVLFSEKGYTELSFLMRDDLKNLLKLGLHAPD